MTVALSMFMRDLLVRTSGGSCDTCECTIVVDNARLCPKPSNKKKPCAKRRNAGSPRRSVSTPAESSFCDNKHLSRWEARAPTSLHDQCSTAFAVTSPTAIREGRMSRWETDRSPSSLMETLKSLELPLVPQQPKEVRVETSRSTVVILDRVLSATVGDEDTEQQVIQPREKRGARPRLGGLLGLVPPQRQTSDQNLRTRKSRKNVTTSKRNETFILKSPTSMPASMRALPY